MRFPKGVLQMHKQMAVSVLLWSLKLEPAEAGLSGVTMPLGLPFRRLAEASMKGSVQCLNLRL